MTAADDEIERLKVHHIAPVGRNGRLHLPTVGVPPPPPVEPVDEARGGTGQRTRELDSATVRDAVVASIREIYDPEIPVNIYDLGLIYGVDVDEAGHVEVRMTLTAPACPVAGVLVEDVARRVGRVEGVATSHVRLVWDPPWTKDRMSEDALLELGLL